MADQVFSRPSPRNARLATGLVYGVAAAVIIAVHLATNGTLGFHMDELYYLACGRHPAFGYVDFPPVVPLLARLETGVLGVTPWTLRLLPALLSGVNVVLCGAYVRKLRGSLRLQALALLIGVTATAIVGTWLFQTVIFDQVTWMVALYLFLCLVIEQRPRTWVLLGVTLGIGVEVKYTILALAVGMGIAVLLTPSLRNDLRTRWPWLAALLALLIWSPNIVWQLANGLPSLAYVANHEASVGSDGGPIAYLASFLLLPLLLTPLWIAGLISLFRNGAVRPIGIACTVPLVAFLFVGKYYYAAPTIPIVMAAGLLALSRVERRTLRSVLTTSVAIASVLGFVALMKITVPTTPESRLHASGLDGFYGDTVGWPQITRQLTLLYGAIPQPERRTTVIISSYYGVTGALDVYGNASLLPPTFSPQLSDYLWLPPDLGATEALMVGYAPSDIGWMCTSPRVVAHLTVPYNVSNLERGMPVTLCHLRQPLPQVWRGLRNFS